MANKKVVLVGRGDLTLSQNDHVATGGEGSVYKKAGTVVKLYTDTVKMVRDGMIEKLDVLSRFDHEFIVAPQGLVTSQGSKQKPLGYWMDYAEGEALTRITTNSYRQKVGFTDDDSSVLVDRMLGVVSYAHQHQAVMVDANELNWVVKPGGKKGPRPYVLDVDSWAIGKWPAKVIMPSIRDWHSKTFDEQTDWFAWGVVTFQIYAGIHPYKGKLDGFEPRDMEQRMKANASVFAKGVRLNKSVRDFSCIPGQLLDWYVNTFQHGKRTVPPSPFDVAIATNTVAKVARVVITATGKLSFEKLFGDSGDKTIRIYACGVVLLKSGRLYDLTKKREIGIAKSPSCEVVETENGWLKADWEDKKLVFSYVNRTSLKEEALALNLQAYELVTYEQRLFAVTDQGLTEVTLKVLGKKPILSVGNTWGVMNNATKWFDGVGIQDAMGAMFVVVPYGDKAVTTVRVDELDGLKPVLAKAGNRFVVIMCVDKTGEYVKFELTFDRDYKSYQVWQGGSATADLNMSMLPKGVVAKVVDDGELNIFVPANGNSSKVADKGISTDMTLGNWGDKVVYIQEGNVWHMKVS